MKKHNESKSTKGIRRSKGKFSCTIISFTLIFVMLFCISAFAETQTITVRDNNYNDIEVNVEVNYTETNEDNITVKNKNLIFSDDYIINDDENNIIEVSVPTGIVAQYKISKTENTVNIFGYVDQVLNAQIMTGTITEAQFTENGTTTNVGGAALEARLTALRTRITAIETSSTYDNIYVEEVPPVYEGFIGNARGLFDMLFESIQSIFNWLVSPNVIVFFGLGIILSLTTIGILIARRFFWGR